MELVFIRTPSVVIELSARGSIWAASKAYDWYSPTISETEILHQEFDKLKFELEELKDPHWIVVDKSL